MGSDFPPQHQIYTHENRGRLCPCSKDRLQTQVLLGNRAQNTSDIRNINIWVIGQLCVMSADSLWWFFPRTGKHKTCCVSGDVPRNSRKISNIWPSHFASVLHQWLCSEGGKKLLCSFLKKGRKEVAKNREGWSGVSAQYSVCIKHVVWGRSGTFRVWVFCSPCASGSIHVLVCPTDLKMSFLIESQEFILHSHMYKDPKKFLNISGWSACGKANSRVLTETLPPKMTLEVLPYFSPPNISPAYKANCK